MCLYRCVHVCVTRVPVSTCTCHSVMREGERTPVRLGFLLLRSRSLVSFLRWLASELPGNAVSASHRQGDGVTA